MLFALLLKTPQRPTNRIYTHCTEKTEPMSISELLLLELDEEMKKTRTTLERVPADKKDFAPHPKSMPLGNWLPTSPNSPDSASPS